jgi:tripartite-type tricarboxylate transporter receptor subunit TctC
MTIMNCIRLGIAGIAVAAIAGPASAQPYPSRPVTLITPFAAGSVTDATARAIAQHLQDALGQSFVVENRAGAGGLLAANAVARAAPDGHTLLITTNSTHSAAPGLFKSVPYDPIKDFAPIGRIGSFIFMLTVNSSVPANTLQELVAYSKANPGKLSYAVANSVGMAVLELLKASHGLDVTAVPYRSMPQAVTDLIAGRVSILVVDRGPILPHLQSHAVRALMLTGGQRSRLQPDVPSAREAGTDIDIVSWVALFAPAGTPSNAITRIGGELRAVVNDPKVRDLLAPEGFETGSSGPEDVSEVVKADIARWKKLVADAGIELQ